MTSSSSGEKQHLLDQFDNPNISRSSAFQSVYEFLSRPENASCWWCQHPELSEKLLEVLEYEQTPIAQQIWHTMSGQLGACTRCIMECHHAQSVLLANFEPNKELLGVLWRLDKLRLLGWVSQQQQQQQQQACQDQSADTSAQFSLSQLQLHALSELLGFPHYVDDQQLCAAAVGLLQQAQWSIAVSEEALYSGLFRFLAHPDAAVRSKVLAMVTSMGPLASVEVVRPMLEEVLDYWLTALHQAPPAGAFGVAAQRLSLVQHDQQQSWPRSAVWVAMKTVFGLLKGDCMSAALEVYPTLMPAVLAQAMPSAYPPAPAAPPGLLLAGEGSPEQKHALSCLHSILTGLHQERWQLNCVTQAPQQMVLQLQRSCWAAVTAQDAALLKGLLQVLQALAQALIPYMAVAAGPDGFQESEEDEEQDPAAVAAAVRLDAAECKAAVLLCLRMLLVQLPGSASVSLLMRGLALEAGLAVCLSALQSTSCPGTAVFAHLWAPVCAVLLTVPSDAQGQALRQHQAPGGIHKLLDLRQVAGLQERVTSAAAELVATALQADAAVLQDALRRSSSATSRNQPWLVPSALDVVELSLNSPQQYTCAPSMWLTLAGCGHAVVSASFIAAAAQLVPLCLAAEAAASRLQTVWHSAQQQLEASLQLPDPETVDLLSTAHAVFTLESAGWLHQQFINAAVQHLHICSFRSRFFLLPVDQRTPRMPHTASGQPTIDAVFKQLSASTGPPPDSSAPDAYALAVQGCCTLMLQGKSGPLAVLAADAEQALLSSCGVPRGQLKQAVQQHLVAPGSVCADTVIQALSRELQQLPDQQKVMKAIIKAPEHLSSFLDVSGFALSAAISHGLDVMMPLFASFLPGLWQLAMDCLSAGCKLFTQGAHCAACSAPGPGLPGSMHQPLQQPVHIGPGVGAVLLALLDALPSLWQCHQALIAQRCEQRQLYLDAHQDEEEPLSQPSGHAAGAGAAVAAELNRQSAWLVQLLTLGRHLHAAPAPGATVSTCLQEAAADRRLRLAWRASLDDVVKATRSPLPKVVKSAAADLLQSNEPSLDKIWLAQLFPTVAPGNLASSGLGNWPSHLPASSAAAAGAVQPAGTTRTAAAAGEQRAAAVAASEQNTKLSDMDMMELLGDWDDGSDHAADEAAPSDSDEVIIIEDSDEPDQQQQQQQQPSPFMASAKQQGAQAWPWLRRPSQQQQDQRQPQKQPDAQQGVEHLKKQQEEIKKAVSRLLQSSKTMHATPKQKEQQQQQRQQDSLTAAASLRRPPSEELAPPAARGGALISAAQPPAAAAGGVQGASEHLLKFKKPSRSVAAGAGAGAICEQQHDKGPPPEALKRVHRPGSTTTQPAVAGQAPASSGSAQQQEQHQQLQGAGSKQSSGDLDVDSLWPEEWADVCGRTGADAWPIGRFNREVKQRKAAVLEGLSKADQLRMELLGKPPANSSSSTWTPAAAAAAGSHHTAQHQGKQRAGAAGGRQTGSDSLTAAERSALHRTAAQLLRQQRRKDDDQTLHERWLQRQQDEQQQALRRQQLKEQSEQRRKQAEAARAEEAAAAEQAKQQAAAAAAAAAAQRASAAAAAAAAPAKTGISLVSDDALFKQAAAAAAASRPRPVRHQGAMFLRASRPPVMGLGRSAPAAPVRHYPVLKLEEVWAELLSWGYTGAVGGRSGSRGAAAPARAPAFQLLEDGKVPLRFTSVGHYCAVFRDLLLAELRAGLAAAHEEHVAGGSSSSSTGRGMGFRSLPIYIDTVQRQSKVCVLSAQVDTSSLQRWERDSPRADDFVLVTRGQLNSGADLAEDSLPHSHLSGLVVEASHLQPELRQITLHCCPTSAGSETMAQFWKKTLAPRMQLWVTVISSLVPNFREFQALCALQHAPAGDRLLRTVLSPQPPGGAAAQHVAALGPAPDSSSQQLAALPAGLRQALQAEYNSSQCAAVAACMDQRFPFVLVQGPPGTGKTSAIIGMLSALLSTGEKPQSATWRAQGPAPRAKAATAAAGKLKPPSVAAKRAASGALAAPKDAAAAAAAGDADSSLPARAAHSALRLGARPPVRVLVCAQSNAAIDELIIRLADKGVWCGSGARRALGMVRVGRSDAMHPSMLMFHVDALADTHVQQEAQKRAQAAAAGGQHQDQQQLQQGGKAGRAASAATTNAAAADKGPGAQSPLDRKIQELTEQLQEVEKKLAALAKQGTAEAEATEAHPEPAEQSQLAAQQSRQQQQGLVGQKRSSDAVATAQSAGADQGSMPPPASKLPRVAGAADVAAGRTAEQDAQPASSGSDIELNFSGSDIELNFSGSDMELSDDGMAPQHDSTAPSHARQLPAVTSRQTSVEQQQQQQPEGSVGHRAAAADSSRLDDPQHRSRGASTAENPEYRARSRSRHRDPAGQHSSRSPSEQGSEGGNRHKRSVRSRSPGRRGSARDRPQRPRSSSKGGSSRSRRHRSRSRSRSRGSGGRKRSRRSSSRGRSSRSPDGRHSHRRSSEGERGAEGERNRDRDRGRHESNRSSRDGSRRGRSRSRDRGRDRGGFSPEERGTAAGDRAGRSRDNDRTRRSSNDPDRRRSNSRDRVKDGAGGNSSSSKAGRDDDAGRPQDRPADKSSRGSYGVHQRIGGSSSKCRSSSSDKARAGGKDVPAMIAGQSSGAERADSMRGSGQPHVAAGGAGHQGSHQQAPSPAMQEAQQQVQQHHASRRQQEHSAEQQQPFPPFRQEEGEQVQRQQQHPAAVASLLRDKQRSLLAALRELERQRGEGGATGGMDRRELDRAKKGARQEVIKAAEVVLCTLSASGGDLLNAFPSGAAPLFDVLVVDEAAQALEPATLIPLQLIKPGTGRVVLVGDPRQLPPTVLSHEADKALAQSLFQRLENAGWPRTMLQEQYRSHPAISAFPSRRFYDGQLRDGAGVNAETRGAPFHSNLALGPMVVWDCREGRERGGGSSGRGGSLQNPAEAQLAATLVAGLLASYRSSVGSIAVISPYKAQVACLRNEFRRELGGDAALAAANIEFGTVDGFQGREADVVIFSCVRAQPEAAATAAVNGASGGAGGPRIGFVQDLRRMNVGLTRGRRAMWVVCHADTLAVSSAWRPLLQDARSRGVLLTARKPFRRLLTAPDWQLRGSHWTPASPAAAATASQGPTQSLTTGTQVDTGPNVVTAEATATVGAAGAAAAANAAAPPGPAGAAGGVGTHRGQGPLSSSAEGSQQATAAPVHKQVLWPPSAAAAQDGAAAAATEPTTGQQRSKQQPQQQQTGRAGPPPSKGSTSSAAAAATSASKPRSTAVGPGPCAPSKAAAQKPLTTGQRHLGADTEGAAWAAADAALAAIKPKGGNTAADGKPTSHAKAGAASAAAGLTKAYEALQKRLPQQQEQRRQQQKQPAVQGGRAATAAAAEGQPIAHTTANHARRTVLRPGQQLHQGRQQQQQQQQRGVGQVQQPPQQQDRAKGRPPAGTAHRQGGGVARAPQGGGATRRSAAAVVQPQQRQQQPTQQRQQQQQQQPTQAQLQAALLARLAKQKQK